MHLTQMVQTPQPPFRQTFRKAVVAGLGSTDHVRCEECGDHRHRYYNRIEEFADDAKCQSQRGNNEGKLANLRHRETAAHRCLQGLAAEHVARRAEHRLTQQDGQRDYNNGQPLREQNLRVDQHAHRHEEHSSEKILHRFYQTNDLVCLDGLGQNTTHDEGTES